MREFFGNDRGLGMPHSGDPGNGMQPGAGPAGFGQGTAGRYPMEGRYVCPFCGAVNETMEGPCPHCTMTNTAETRKATKSRIGPWYVLQSRNPAAPGMKYETLLGFVRKGRVKARSIVRGPTTHQLWRFACQVKGLSREFGLCYSCGGSIERDAQLCPQCNRLQDPPPDPDVFVEGQTSAVASDVQMPTAAAPVAAPTSAPAPAPVVPPAPPAPLPAADDEFASGDLRSAVFKEITLPPPLSFPAIAPEPSGREIPAAPPPPQAAPAPTPAPQVIPLAPAPAAAPAQPPVSPAPTPAGVDAPRKRHAQDVILNARELAAAFQLDFDGPEPVRGAGRPVGGTPPWDDAAEASLTAPRSAPRRHRRKRRTGRVLLLLVLLVVGGFAAVLAINPPVRQRVFDWAQAKYMAWTGQDLYPDLARPGRGRSGPPPTGRDNDTAGIDAAYTAAASAAPRPMPTSQPKASVGGTPRTTEVPVGPAQAAAPSPSVAGPRIDSSPRNRVEPTATTSPAPSDVFPSVARATPSQPPVTRAQPQASPPPAATQPVRPGVAATQPSPEPPRLTIEQAQRKSRELWIQALDAEERSDYAKAKSLYEQMMTTLPRDAWYQGVEARLRLVKNELGEK